jgi:hypothetical protein
MIKAGLIGAFVAVIYVMGLTLISPFCTICLTPLLGFGVGYLASQFARPLRHETAITTAATAGVMTGVGAMIGQMLASMVNAVLVTNSEELPMLFKELGLTQLVMLESSEYWQTTIFMNSFCSILNLAIIVGLAVSGSLYWMQRHHKRTVTTLSS